MINMRVETCKGEEQRRVTGIVQALNRQNNDGEESCRECCSVVIVRGRVVGERVRQRLEPKACVGIDEKRCE
jgi:hypothetical protein